MAKKLFFHDKREANYQTVNGVGTLTVTVDFMPNFIEAVFKDVQTKLDPAAPDTLELGQVTKLAANSYQVEFDYNVGEERTVKWVIAKLPVNPEATISF